MALRTKLYYGEQVLNELNSQLRNRDEKIDIREAIIRIDAIVNSFAKEGILLNWKRGFTNSLDEQFITRWEFLTITDPSNGEPSYFQIPAHYVELPDNRGIDQVYFQNSFSSVKKKYFDPVIIRNYKSVSQYRSNRAGNMEGRISCSPRNGNIVFNTGNIGATYGDVGIALVVRDSSALSDSDPYPIAADQEQLIIQTAVEWFRARQGQKPDLIRDDVNKT